MVLLDVLIVGNWARASSPGASAMPCAVAAAALASGRVVRPAAKRTRLRPLSAISQALALTHVAGGSWNSTSVWRGRRWALPCHSSTTI